MLVHIVARPLHSPDRNLPTRPRIRPRRRARIVPIQMQHCPTQRQRRQRCLNVNRITARSAHIHKITVIKPGGWVVSLQWDQGKKLGFPWIPLADSGLFNGLWRIQIKKIPPLSFDHPVMLFRLSFSVPQAPRDAEVRFRE
jgi:hypothetical protein